MDPVTWLILFILNVAISYGAAYLMRPKPSTTSNAAVQDLEVPTADAGKPMPVLFGEMTVKAPNTLNYTDKSTNRYDVKV